jgi:hypothetical protein
MQYRNAKALLATINEDRPPREPYYRHCLNAIAFACFLPIRILFTLSMLSREHPVCQITVSIKDTQHGAVYLF